MQSLTVDKNSLSVLRWDSFNFNQVNIFLVKKIVKFAISSCKKTKGLLERPSLSLLSLQRKFVPKKTASGVHVGSSKFETDLVESETYFFIANSSG